MSNTSLERAKWENFPVKRPTQSSQDRISGFFMKSCKKIPPISLASTGPFLVKETSEKLINKRRKSRILNR
jgi:hypothetical protein